MIFEGLLKDDTERKNTVQDLIEGYNHRRGLTPAIAEDIDIIATHRARQQVSSVRYVENEHDIYRMQKLAEIDGMKK